jgi:hypothetical protein
MNDQPAKLVTFGNGGDTVYYSALRTGHGYGNPESPHAADPERHNIPDGTPVIDKREAVNTPEGLKLSISGPMVNVDLEMGEVERCPEPSAILAAGMRAQGGACDSLLKLQAAHRALDDDEPGPLDSVSIPQYCMLWRAVGARLGTYMNGQIEWSE